MVPVTFLRAVRRAVTSPDGLPAARGGRR